MTALGSKAINVGRRQLGDRKRRGCPKTHHVDDDSKRCHKRLGSLTGWCREVTKGLAANRERDKWLGATSAPETHFHAIIIYNKNDNYAVEWVCVSFGVIKPITWWGYFDVFNSSLRVVWTGFERFTEMRLNIKAMRPRTTRVAKCSLLFDDDDDDGGAHVVGLLWFRYGRVGRVGVRLFVVTGFSQKSQKSVVSECIMRPSPIQ